MWNYKCHSVLRKVLHPVWLLNFVYFVDSVSWTYAHYRNGNFPKIASGNDRWQKMSFWAIVKEEWNGRENWQNE